MNASERRAPLPARVRVYAISTVLLALVLAPLSRVSEGLGGGWGAIPEAMLLTALIAGDGTLDSRVPSIVLNL